MSRQLSLKTASVQPGTRLQREHHQPGTPAVQSPAPRFQHDFSRIQAHGGSPLLQPKLAFSTPGDPYEQEAERVAGQMVGQLGSPLPDGSVTTPFEPLFGQDFSTVRVHQDAQAALSARALGAHAFTVGEDIYFGEGQFQPHSAGGQQLIAHELTHVVQQRATGRPMVQGSWWEVGGAIVGGVMGALALSGGGIGGIIAGLAVGGLVGALAGSALKHLFSDSEDLDKTEPTDQGLDPQDPQYKATLERNFIATLDKLGSSGCAFPEGGKWKYDKRYWKPVTEDRFVAYKPKGVSPAKAVDELTNNLNLWEFDCAIYPEVAWVIAFRRTLGAARFNEKFKDLVLKQHHTKGLKRDFYEVSDVGEAEFDKLWDEAPVGSKVMWTNKSSVTEGTAWKNENAIKRTKGATPQDDRYDAHPLGSNLSEEQVKRGLAENADDYPRSGSNEEKKEYVRKNIYRSELHIFKD